jgi:signal peptidase II
MPRSSLIRYLLVSLVILVADQVTKFFIVKNLTENQAVSIIGDLLHFRFIFNEGGAMGTSLGPSWIYTILTLAALYLIVHYFASPNADGVLRKVSLAMILGGAVGNLIDRLRFGKVVDFIDLDFPDISFLNIYRWFTFNIADAAITIGLVLFGISILIRKKKEPGESTSDKQFSQISSGSP